MESVDKRVVKNKYGYYELVEKPAPDELSDYYHNKYYQEGRGSYEISYTPEEIQYFRNKIAQMYAVIEQLYVNKQCNYRNFLDVGCGEGWSLQYFREKGWHITGLDYSEFGCSKQNPACRESVLAGDIYLNIEGLKLSGRRYDVILLDNVLEHVTEPFSLLESCKSLLQDDGVLIIEVPNDFSTVQEHFVTQGIVSHPYWISVPDHISYFSREGLIALCKEAELHCDFLMADFPIEWNLFNEQLNYVEDRSKGKSCHQARVNIENFLHAISLEKTVELYRVLADLGMGRCLTGFFRVTSSYN